jgi:hypothetical protein
MMTTELEALKAQNAELSDRIAKLEAKANPEPFVPEPRQPIDYTAGMSMPANAIAAMVAAVPSSLMSDLRADALKPNPVTHGRPQSEPSRERGTGWVNPQPIQSPPGVALADRLMDEQDKLDRAERARAFARASALSKE